MAITGQIMALDIDTSFFMGNNGSFASVDACFSPGGDLSKAKVAILFSYAAVEGSFATSEAGPQFPASFWPE